MAAGIYNFTIEQGTTFTRTFKYKDSSGGPLDLSEYAITMDIRDNVDSPTRISKLSTSEGSFVVSIPSDGDGTTPNQIDLTISSTLTASYNFNTAVYDIEIDNGSVVTRLLQGKIKLSKEVTRED
jgi:hypothetical protein